MLVVHCPIEQRPDEPILECNAMDWVITLVSINKAKSQVSITFITQEYNNQCLRIIMNRARNRIIPEIGKEQCGFIQDSGTRNAIFMMRMLSERAIEMQKHIYVCFIDYTKAFDKVRNVELFDLLQHLDLNGKDIRLIRNLYSLY